MRQCMKTVDKFRIRVFRGSTTDSDFRSFNNKEAPLRLSAIIIARHPEYDLGSGSLTPQGIERANDLAMQITDKIPSISGVEHAIIVTSTAKRTAEAADILSHALGIPVEQSNVFLTDAFTVENIPAAINFIEAKQDDYDVIIIVTHLEYTDVLPRACGHAFFGGRARGLRNLRKGEAFIVQRDKATLLR